MIDAHDVGSARTGRSLPRLSVVVLTLAAAKLGLHLATNLFGAYGYIRDELYYLACADHLAWGYVDHPPLSIAALWVARYLFGDSLVALRLLPALSGAAVILLAGLLARELGGGRIAQGLASLCVLSAPLLLGFDSVFSMNAFDVLFWTLAFYQFVRAAQSERDAEWILLGLVLGLGLLNKISVLWLLAGLGVGLVFTPTRRVVLTHRPWIAAAVAAAVFLPHLVWQVVNDYPTLEFIRNAGSGKYLALSPVDLFLQQSLFMNPVTVPLWVGGLGFFLFSKSLRPYRVLPIAYLVVFAILAINGYSKAAYLGPIIPMLFVLGAVAFERLTARVKWSALTPMVAVLVAASGAALVPLVLAVLPVETYIRYAQALGVAPTTSEHHAMGRLPQHYADMFGWPEMVKGIADAYATLSAEDRSRCAILCNNYGEAGAVDFFGRQYGLPRAISRHNNYFLWGPRGATGEVVIKLGGTAEELAKTYRQVVPAGVVTHPYSMRYESDLPIWICRGRRIPFAADWATMKVFN